MAFVLFSPVLIVVFRSVGRVELMATANNLVQGGQMAFKLTSKNEA